MAFVATTADGFAPAWSTVIFPVRAYWSFSARLGGGGDDATGAGALSRGGDAGSFWAGSGVALPRSSKFWASRRLLDLLFDKAGRKTAAARTTTQAPAAIRNHQLAKREVLSVASAGFLWVRRTSSCNSRRVAGCISSGAPASRRRCSAVAAQLFLDVAFFCHVVRCLTELCRPVPPQKSSGRFFPAGRGICSTAN